MMGTHLGPSASAGSAVRALWFLGTLVRVKLDGEDTGGRLGLFEVTMPGGASPPLHSHRQAVSSPSRT